MDRSSRTIHEPFARAAFSATLRVLPAWLAWLLGALPVAAQPQGPIRGVPPALVETAVAVHMQVRAEIVLAGTAAPTVETVVAAEHEGLVRQVLVDEGERVVPGQVLCLQDTSQLRLRIDAAGASLAEAKVLLARAEREWVRQKRLYAIQSVSERAYENARFEVQALRKKVERLGVERRVLEDQVRKKTIRAPVGGYVTSRHVEIGQWLGEGKPVVTLAVLDPVRLVVPVPERHIAGIRRGDSAQVRFDALPGRTFQGLIQAVIPQAEAGARTFPVRIEIANADAAIKAGMLGRARIPLGEPYQALLVPKDALVLSGEQTAVFVINDRHARLVRVRAGRAHGSLIEIVGDLTPGAAVVVRGNERLRPGQPVQIRPSGNEAPGKTRSHEAG